MMSKAPGGPETLVLETVADPTPAADEILIQVHACGVNYPDVLLIEDRYQVRPSRPFTPGGEISGTVASLGGKVSGLAVGDRVLAQVGLGGMAEQVTAKAAKCIGIPAEMSFVEAAAFITTYGTSYHALKQRGRIKRGESLLVLGAGGGVGMAAVELGRAMGATVIAAASTQEKVDLALTVGASSGFVYPRGDFDEAGRKSLAALFKQHLPAAGVDLVYDSIGGPYSEAALRALAWRGRLLVIGFPAGIASPPLNLALLKGAEIVGVFYGAFVEREPEESAVNTQELLGLYSAGKIRPHVSQIFPLARAGEAIAHLSSRQALGKVVVSID